MMNQRLLKNPEDKEQINKKYLIILGVLYFIALIWIIVFKCNINRLLCVDPQRAQSLEERLFSALSAKPFGDLISSTGIRHKIEICALLGNILGFIPLGMLLRYFFKGAKSFIISIAVSTAIEIFQLLSCYGGLKIEDIVEYTLGALIGIILCKKLIPKINPTIINNATCVLIYIAIPCDLFFIINTIIHFPE